MKKLVVIGGGITGLGVALFAKQKNFDIPVYEKNAEPAGADKIDSLLLLAPNGMHLLAALGLEAEVIRHSVAQDVMLFSNHRFKTLMSLDSHKFRDSNGYPIRAIKRGVLHQIMLDKFLATGGKIHYEHKLMNLSQGAGKVMLEFENQAQALVCDAVIGADGINSNTRRMIAPQSRVTYRGFRTYCGHSLTPIAKRFIGQTIETWGDNGSRFTLTSLDDRSIFWSAMEKSQDGQKNSTKLDPLLLDHLRESFSEYHADIQDVLENAVPSSIHRGNFGFLSKLDKFYLNKVCLVGDAAHGMPPKMGRGASLALEDAYCLIDSLAREQSVRAAWVQYDRLQRPRVRQVMQMFNGMNSAFQSESKFASKVRNLVAAAIPQPLAQMRISELYKIPYNIDSDIDINLADHSNTLPPSDFVWRMTN